MTDALTVAVALVLSSGSEWGAVAVPWQLDDLRAVVSESGPRLHFVTRPRGASKTTDLAVAALALLLTEAPRAARCYAVAADADQAGLLLDAIRGLVARTPGLPGLVRVEARRVVVVQGGASLEVLAADGPSAYGLLPWLVIADEVAIWPETPNARQVWEAVVSAMPKVPGARLMVLTSAGSPSHWSHKVLVRARSSSAWRVSELPGPTPWLDPAALDEQRALLTPSAFARLHLNVWTEPEDRLTTVDDLRACVVLDAPQPPQPGRSYLVSLDMAFVNDRAVAAVCHRDGTRVVLDHMEVWTGSRRRPVREADVEAWIRETWRAYRPSRLVIDPWQTKGMAQRLRTHGVRVEEFTFSSTSVGHIALSLYRALRDHAIALPDDEELLDELGRVRLREASPGVYRLDHASGEHDDRAVALAMAVHALVGAAPGGPARTSSAAGRSIDPHALDEPELRFGDGSRRRIASGSVQDMIGGRFPRRGGAA